MTPLTTEVNGKEIPSLGATLVVQADSVKAFVQEIAPWKDTTQEAIELPEGMYGLVVGNEHIDWQHFRKTRELVKVGSQPLKR